MPGKCYSVDYDRLLNYFCQLNNEIFKYAIDFNLTIVNRQENDAGVGVDHIPLHGAVGALVLHNTLAMVRGYSHVVAYTAKTDDVGSDPCATQPDQRGATAPTLTSLSYPLTMQGNACQLSGRADSMHSRPYLAKAPSIHACCGRCSCPSLAVAHHYAATAR